MKFFIKTFLFSSIVFFISGCETTRKSNYTPPPSAERVTIGTVQRSIRKGMYSYEVVEVLGAPNMVTKNTEGCETWVYDKIHSEYETRTSDGGLSLGIGGGGLIGRRGGLGGGLGVGTSSAKASGVSSERTLTIVIHFDSESRVSDFSYRTTSF
jgi:outer membrane protein assembly factor BamE (lipoprotein component of BamABCDE complex)